MLGVDLSIPTLAGASRRFSPSSLFAAGEQGIWLDPSDFSTMFQDTAGTTPVTAVEQPVGKILDKSGRGNHATQASEASRPVLSARVNLLTYTEDFTNPYWGKNALVTVSQAGSVGTISVPSTVGSGANIFFKQSISPFANGPTATARIEVRCTTGQSISLASDTGVTTVTMTAEWQTINLTSTIASSFHQFYIRTAVGSQTYSFDIRYADLRITNDGVGLPAYQRVTTSTDYDTSGFPLYLKFDGTDDSLATGSIDFTATDKMSVFAGVRKLSDAAQGIVAELTASIALNNGAFALTAPNSAAANYNFSSKGTTQVDNTVTTYTTPLTSVLTGLGNISGPANTVRVNGTQVGSVTTTQGTGNYSNAVLYIGRRGGTTLSFNGRLYSLIVRGAQSTDAQIASTETWVNSKTGAY